MQTSIRRFSAISSAVVLVATLAACAAPGPSSQVGSASYPATYPTATSPAYVEYGRVTNVEVVSSQEKGKGSGVGAVLGAVAGGVIGNQVGSGGGRDVARVAGIVGGGLAGNAIEKNSKTRSVENYRVSVQTDNGATRAYDVSTGTDLRAGDRVRIENGTLYRI
jgi:outer membrane lipoprotein SlyB